MAILHVVLVEPKSEGNVGAVARAMKNFGVEHLHLVNPPPLREEAHRRAMHGADVLAAAKVHASLWEALQGMDLVVATTGIATESEKRFVRIPLPPSEFAQKISEVRGTVALLFGREDYGLHQDEIARADILVTIPTSEAYPILNLSHAAAILLYEAYARGQEVKRPRLASGMEKEKLHEAFAALLDEINYPAHHRGRTTVMFRRLLGRATPSKWEFHALMGVLTRSAKTIRRLRSTQGP